MTHIEKTYSAEKRRQRMYEIERDERRELAFFSEAEARRATALECPFQTENLCPKWVKVVWYGDEVGGKIITFKAGSPYGAKTGHRKEGENLNEDEREARRLANSLSRTRRRIFEIAACNEWEWFFTGTLDGSKVDRNDLNATFRKLSQWIRDYRKKQDGERITYMIVPEQHKNGAWHFHGLLNGLSEHEMHEFSVSENIPARIKAMITGGTPVFTWRAYAEKFGYATVTRVRDATAVSCYVTKYITKDMVRQNAALGTRRHLYYASQGLKKPVTLAESYPATSYAPMFDYENEWVEIRKISTREEAEAAISRFGLIRAEE